MTRQKNYFLRPYKCLKMLGGGQETYNKEPATTQGTLVNLLVRLA